METQTKKKWYDYNAVVIILCLIFFPVGLYGLWKGNMSKGVKIGLTVVISIFVLAAVGNDKNKKIEEHTSQDVSKTVEQPRKADIEILQDKASTDALGIMTVYVVVRNNSDELKHYVQVDASFFDKDGGIVGTGIGNTSNLAAHSERTINVLAMDIHNAATYKLDVKDGF